MKKNNKGFTLIEVLATIAIIAVVTLIATITYSKVRTNILKREYKNLKTLIETAGVKYTSKTGIDTFYVLELIEQGYLEPDDASNNIYDPRDGHPLNCHEVKVDRDTNGNYVAELKEGEHKVNDGCDPNRGHPKSIDMTLLIHNTGINYLTTTNSSEIGSQSKNKTTKPKTIYDDINIVVDGSNRWTSKQLDITANILSQSGFIPYYLDINGAKYVWNRNTDTTTVEPNRSYTTNFIEFFNDDFYLDLYTKDGKHMQTSKPVKFDQQKPALYGEKTAYGNPLDETRWTATKTLIIYATDRNGVGLDRVYAGSRPCTDLLYDPKMGTKAVSNKTVHYHTVDDLESGIDGNNGDINICAIDKLGNLAEDTFTITKLDVTPPRCQKAMKAKRSDDVIDEDTEYQYAERTIRQYCYDNNMINGKTVIGSGCTATYFEKSWSSTTKVGYIRIKDNVGHTTDCPVNVYVDRTAPVCAKSTGNTQSDKSNHNATTLGVGTTDNWDQNYRHITRYCADDHVGCKAQTYSKNWEWSSSNPIIRTGTIRIYDKVKKCSQKSTINNNCSNYNSIKGTAENDDNYNNHRDCTEGVYIDHVPPQVYQNANAFHGENRVKAYCTDTIDGVEGSGVASFEAGATTRGNTNILPCSSGASNCASGNGPKISNTTGAGLQFKLTYNTLSISDANNVKVTGTCVDKAGNTDQDKELNFAANIASSVGNDYIGVTVDGCQLKEYRAKTAEECSHYSYDCSAHDTSCNSSNSGEKSTCCLQGADPAYGCKVVEENPSKYKDFNGQYVPRQTYKNDPRVQYMTYNGKHYLTPPTDSVEYAQNCYDDNGIIRCSMGRECLVFNCYPDFPLVSAQEVRNYICGNYTR